MFAERKSCLVFIVSVSLTAGACSHPIRSRHAADGSTSSDSAGARDLAAEAQTALPDTPVVIVDTGLDRPMPRDSVPDFAIVITDTPIVIPDAPVDTVVVPADAKRDQADAASPDSKNAGPDVVRPDGQDAGPDVLAVRADGAPEVATDASPASLTVSPAIVAFGPVALGFSSVRTLTIANQGQTSSGPIRFGFSDDFAVISGREEDCQSRVLAGGASCTVSIAFSPSALGDRPGALIVSASLGVGGSARFTGSGVTGTLSFLAGAASGLGSADGTGAAARFTNPMDLALDGSGNLFVSDVDNHTIRRITPAGVVSTFAGKAGFEGSADGPGAEARFSYPHGLCADKSGNIYVGDCNNGTIRKISPAGVVTTLAGSAGEHAIVDGTGAAARFDVPGAMVVDASDNLFVIDGIVVRKITPAGVVSTLAGTAGLSGDVDGTGPAARFNQIGAMTMDGAGNLVVTELDGTLRQITPAGLVTTLMKSGGNDIQGLAMDGAGNFYTADYAENVIRKITPAGAVTTWAGTLNSIRGADGTGSAARFNGPSGMAMDGAGNLFVADSMSCAIRKITPAGVVTTLAGALGSFGSTDGTGAEASFNTPTDVAVDGAGNAFVSCDNRTIRKVTPAGVVTTLAGSPDVIGSEDGTGSNAHFSGVAGIAVDATGNLIVADRSGCTLRKVTPAGVVTTWAGAPNTAGSADGVGSAALFNWPSGVAFDKAGNLFVTDSFNHTIRKITPAGAVTTLAGMAGFAGSQDGAGATARFNYPSGIAVDGLGDLLITDILDETVRKITPAGVVTTLAGGAGLSGSADGTGSAARFTHPSGLALDGAGNAFVADCANNAIRKVTPAGVVTTVVGVLSPIAVGAASGPLPGSIVCPKGVAFNPAGRLVIVADNAVMLASW